MSGRVTRWLTGIAATVAAGIAITWSMQVAIEVDVVAASRGPLLVTVDEQGKTRVAARFLVSAPVSGGLDRVGLRPGDRVEAGAVVATIRPAEATPLDTRTAAQLQATLEAARDALARAEASAGAALAATGFARAETARARLLGAAGALSRAQVDRAVTAEQEAEEALAGATAAVKVAAHDVEAARAAVQPPAAPGLARAVAVRAPQRGVVLRVLEEHERVVAAGTPIVEIGDPNSLEVVVDVLSTDGVRIRPGARVLFEHWGGEEVLEGRVRYIEPSTFTKISALGVEEQRVNVIVDFAQPATAHPLGDGYALAVRIVTAEAADALTIPAGGLFRTDGGWAVYALRDDRARLQPVRVGLRAGFDVQVLDGVAANERIIVYPGDRVTDGARVVAR